MDGAGPPSLSLASLCLSASPVSQPAAGGHTDSVGVLDKAPSSACVPERWAQGQEGRGQLDMEAQSPLLILSQDVFRRRQSPPPRAHEPAHLWGIRGRRRDPLGARPPPHRATAPSSLQSTVHGPWYRGPGRRSQATFNSCLCLSCCISTAATVLATNSLTLLS